MAFGELGLSAWLVNQVKAVGFHKATPVQLNCIPPILQGNLKLNLSSWNVIITDLHGVVSLEYLCRRIHVEVTDDFISSFTSSGRIRYRSSLLALYVTAVSHQPGE